MSRQPLATEAVAHRSIPRSPVRFRRLQDIPRRTAPYHEEPGYSEEAQLWLFGNAKLLDARLTYVPDALGPPIHSPSQLDAIERQTEQAVLDGRVLVCGIHSPAHRRVAIVPLRWGSPRILVFSGGFRYHLGPDLKDEPFNVARLWRYEWDRETDLAVSRRAPDKLPTYAMFNQTVDRLIERIAHREVDALLFNGRMPIRTATVETLQPSLFARQQKRKAMR